MSLKLTCRNVSRHAELVFVARLPPLGYSTFFVQPCAHSMHDSSIGKLEEAAHRDSAPKPAGPTDAKLLQASNGSTEPERYVLLDNGVVSLEFDTYTGERLMWSQLCCAVLFCAGHILCRWQRVGA